MNNKKVRYLSDETCEKSIFMDGKQLSGCISCSIEYSANKSTTVVHLALTPKNKSVMIDRDNIQFETIKEEDK